VSRRLGFNFEDNSTFDLVYTPVSGEVFTEFVWNAIDGDGGISFLVQQHGKTLHFYNVSSSTTISPNRKSFSIDLTTLVPSGSGLDPAQYPCQYASGRGILTLVNRAIKPTYIEYKSISDTITATSYELQVRDFTGVDDGLGLTQRPTSTVAALKSGNPEHYYNLLNQGWGEVAGAALSAWDTARTDLPSNADVVSMYRPSATSIFDNARVLAQDPLTTPAPKGHFILTVTNPDRTAAMVADGFTGASLTNPSVIISQSAGSILVSGWTNFFGGSPTFIFDGATSRSTASDQYGVAVDSNAYVGKNYSGSPKQISQAIVYGTTDSGFQIGANPTITYTLYAKQTAPSSKTDGTVLGTNAFADPADGSGGKIITSSDTTTFWNYVWVAQDQGSGGGGGNTPVLVELEFYSPGTNPSTTPTTFERPKTVCFYAGRLFYAGLDAFSLNNTIFFTQILQKETQYGQCYQQNDPTSEITFDLLSSDGGTIVIPEMSTVHKLFAYQNTLFILASNGIWQVSGNLGVGGGFSANDYYVRKLSSLGTNAPHSIVDRRGIPIWWGEDGIYTLQFDPNSNTYNVVNVTFKTIRSFYLDIPQVNRKYAKGAYDVTLDIIYWLYNSDPNATDHYAYNSVLVYSEINPAFYPWTIGSVNQTIRGIVAIQDAVRNNLTKIKYVTTYPSSSNEILSYAEAKDTSYLDWSSVDYSSYFITSSRVEAQGDKNIQVGYLTTFFEQEDNSSCFLQGRFDWANSGSSGKWSTVQQVYNPTPYRSLTHSRRKIRGKGPSLSLKYSSDTGKPFNIWGWAIWATGASNV
jgi:hypothetical protein